MPPKIFYAPNAKIIEPLDHWLTNAEVLHWVKEKREQHTKEDAEDSKAGRATRQRPKNFMKILGKTESHLTSDAFPYEKNPTAYKDNEAVEESVRGWNRETMTEIQEPLLQKWKQEIRKGMKLEEAEDKMGDEQEARELTDHEYLMVYNHAPTCVEMLEPLIDEWEERFTKEEMQKLVDISVKLFRVDEEAKKKKAAKNKAKRDKAKAKKAAEKAEAQVTEKEVEEGDPLDMADVAGDPPVTESER